MKNVLEMLEASAGRFPDKAAFSDGETVLSYSRLMRAAKGVGTALARLGAGFPFPVPVIAPRGTAQVVGMLGALYGGGFYTVVDPDSPEGRVRDIFDTLEPSAVVCAREFLPLAGRLLPGRPAVVLEEASAGEVGEELLADVRARMIDADPAYVLFTSGSTGKPKGAVLTHRNVLAYADWVANAFAIDENTVFGNQAPLSFSMSVLDVYASLLRGATVRIIPKKLFSFPVELFKFINDNGVNVIYWVPSALCIAANCSLFKYARIDGVKKVLFAGEVMPVKQLNYWIDSMPEGTLFANLFGPTETTDICSYYVVDRRFFDGESLPIGRSCDNTSLSVITAGGKEAEPGEEGELYVRGAIVGAGYYRDPEKTAESFVRDPLNPYYPETVYRTGDLVKYNDRGELLFVSRIDRQIKHMGYRIEPGEIEAAVGALPGVRAVCCVYDKGKDEIVLVYEGARQADEKTVAEGAAARLPAYMRPQRFIKVPSLPRTESGKTDRTRVEAQYAGGE